MLKKILLMLSNMEYKEFKNSIIRAGKREFKFNKNVGAREMYRYYNKVKPDKKQFVLTEVEYGKIVNMLSKKVIEAVMSGVVINLPLRTGKLFIEKRLIEPKIVNGKLVFRNDVDWEATYKLWFSNAEEHSKKTRVMHIDRVIYRLRFSKEKSCFAAKNIVLFRTQRSVKQLLKSRIKSNSLEGYMKKIY